MKRTLFALAVAAVLFVSAAPTVAADPATTIAPMIDEQTFAVVRIDVAKINTDQLTQWIVGALGIPTDDMQEPIDQVALWQRNFLASGAREIYIVFSLSDLPRKSLPIIVPVPAGVDAAAVTKALQRHIAPNESSAGGLLGSELPLETIKGFVVAAAKPFTFRRLETMTPAARPAMAAAFAAAEGSAVQAVLIPSDPQRQMVAAMLAHVPPPVPTIDPDVLLRGLQWASLGVEITPIPSLVLTLQSQTPADAQKLNTLIIKLIEFAAQDRTIRQIIPDPAPVIRMIKPTVRGDQLVTRIRAEQVSEFVTTQVMPALARARQLAREAVSMANLRGIGQSILMYQVDHNNSFPANLKTLIEARWIENKHLNSPTSGPNAYVYIRPAPGAADSTIVAYENPALAGLTRVPVLFVGSHVVMMPVDDDFWAKVNQAKKLSAAAYGSAGQ